MSRCRSLHRDHLDLGHLGFLLLLPTCQWYYPIPQCCSKHSSDPCGRGGKEVSEKSGSLQQVIVVFQVSTSALIQVFQILGETGGYEVTYSKDT